MLDKPGESCLLAGHHSQASKKPSSHASTANGGSSSGFCGDSAWRISRLVTNCWKPHRPPHESHDNTDNTRQLGGELASPCKECSARLLYKDFDSTPLIKCHLDSALVWSLSRVDGRCLVQLKKYNLETSTPSQFAPIRLRSSLHFAKGSWASLCPQAHKPKASSWSRQKGWFERLCSSLTPL